MSSLDVVELNSLTKPRSQDTPERHLLVKRIPAINVKGDRHNGLEKRLQDQFYIRSTPQITCRQRARVWLLLEQNLMLSMSSERKCSVILRHAFGSCLIP